MDAVGILIAGGVASVLFLVLDAALGVLGGLAGTRIFGLPESQLDPAKMKLGMVFEVINGFMLAIIYALIQPALAGQGWTKGVPYGLMVWGLRVVMWAFSTYMMTNLPPTQIAITTVTGLLEMLIICTAIAAIY